LLSPALLVCGALVLGLSHPVLPLLGVLVDVGVSVAVGVFVGVCVAVGVSVDVGVLDGVGVFDGVLVIVDVGVGAALCSRTTINPR
jgi:hypothetical protein